MHPKFLNIDKAIGNVDEKKVKGREHVIGSNP